MEFDPALALRIQHNERLRTVQGWGDYHDIGGALVVTSDAPIPGLNCVGDFTADERRAEYLLDVGFALLRAFDRDPAVELTPLDRPLSLGERVARRGLRHDGGRCVMVCRRRDATAKERPGIDVWPISPDDARTFADIHSGGARWTRQISLKSTIGAMLDEANTFYLAYVDGQPAGTLHLLCDEATAGIYAVATAKQFRRRGVATALISRAIADASSNGCEVIALSTEVRNDARHLYVSLGFEPLYETQMWTQRG